MTDNTVSQTLKEDRIRQRLAEKFSFLQDKIVIQRPRRIFAEVEKQNLEAVLEFAMRELDFTILCAITGLDNGATLGLIYHMARADGVTLNIRTAVPKDNPVINTVTRYF